MSRNMQMDAEDEGGADFRADLLDIDGDLHADDIKSLKFLVQDLHLSGRQLESINTGHELFNYLEKISCLKEENRWVLAEMLKQILRLDLLDVLKVDENELDQYLAKNGSHFSPYRHLLLKLADDIGDEDLHKLLFCFDIPNAKRQKITNAIDMFTFLEQTKKINPKNVDMLEESFNSIGRRDLSQIVIDYRQPSNNSTPVASVNARSGSAANFPPKQSSVTGLQVQFSKPPLPATVGGNTQDLAIPDSVIQDIARRMSNQQFFVLGITLGLNTAELERIQRGFAQPADRNGHMLKAWLMRNQLSKDQTVLTLSDAMKQVDMTSVANRLEEIFGIQPGLEVSMRQNRREQNLPASANQNAQIVQVTQKMDRMDVDPSPLEYYKMDARPRGICVIINNRDYYKDPGDPLSKEMPSREGTDVDAAKLKNTFEKLDFEVRRYDNLTDTEMARLASEISLQDHSAHDCFVCCVLSHGTEGKLYGVNGRLLSITNLTGPFKAQVCSSLAGKPKLFFIQACQGREKQYGHDIQTDSVTGHIEVDAPTMEVIPNEADFLFGFATVVGFVSFRSRTQGSWYISKLTETLDKYAKKEDLLSLLLVVNNEVCKANANLDGERYKQSPAPLYTLRKKLIFK